MVKVEKSFRNPPNFSPKLSHLCYNNHKSIFASAAKEAKAKRAKTKRPIEPK